MIRTLKIAALSLVVLAGTAGVALASTAWVDDTTKVKEEPYKWADTIGWAKEGKKVWVEECFKAYCFIEQSKGEDGWVRKSDLDFNWGKDDDIDVDVELCFGDPNIKFCVGN